jgi:uncharacterized membrane protein
MYLAVFVSIFKIFFSKFLVYKKNQERFQNIDILRGLLMVIKAIDHAYLIFYQIYYDESWNKMLSYYGSTAIFLLVGYPTYVPQDLLY